MSWEKKIPGAFGSGDKLFARHQADCLRASDLLNTANKENVGWAEYLRTIENWLRNEGCTPNHIEEEVKRVKDLRSYINYD